MEIPVSFRLMDEKIVTVQMRAPCKGADAKRAGKRALEEHTSGVPVKFKSFQEGTGERECLLVDDATLKRGAVLTYTIGKQYTGEAQIMKLLVPLYEDKLQTTVSKLVARSFSEPVSSCQGGRLEAKLASNRSLSNRVAKELEETKCPQSCEAFVKALDNNYRHRKESQHVNTDEVLRAELKKLQDAGVHELMAETMPAEAHIVRYYDRFLKLLT